MEHIKVDLIPKYVRPICHASQYDNGRIIRFDITNDGADYIIQAEDVINIFIRKLDGKLVTAAPTYTAGNSYVDLTTTTQMTAVVGENIGELRITNSTEMIGSINFVLKVEEDPTNGAISSDSELEGLQTLITADVEVALGEVSLDDLGDVQLTTPSEGQVLKYDETSHTWKNGEDTGTTSLSDLTDTTISSPSNGQVLKYSSSDNKWINSNESVPNLDDIGDVQLTTPSEGQGLVYDATSGKWKNGDVIISMEETNSGSIANFSTSLELPLTALSSTIVAKQASGTPTPSSPLPISGVSSVGFYQRGVNLWDEVWEVGAIDPDGNNAKNNNRIRSKNYISVVPSKTYYIKTPKGIWIWGYNYEKTFVARIPSTAAIANTTITIPPDVYYIRFVVVDAYGTTYNNDIAILYPSTQTEYVPYNSQSDTFTISLGQTVYGGVLDAKNGKLVITHVCEELGGLNWGLGTGGVSRFVASPTYTAKAPTAATIEADVISDIFKTVSSRTIYEGTDDYEIAIHTNGVIWVRDTDYSDKDDFKTAMANHYVCYELATPIEITGLTGANFTTFAGENNIFANSGDVEVTYFTDEASETVNLIEAIGVSEWTDLTGTLTAGTTSITFSNAVIKTNSTIQVFTSDGTDYNSITVSNGEIILVFDAQLSDLSVKVRIS